jgi:hypothetical protein
MLVPVLFVLQVYLGWRVKAFETDQVAGINELALDSALPASLFVGVVTIPRSQLSQEASFVVTMVVTIVGRYFLAYDKRLGEFIVIYEHEQNSASPSAALLDFCQSLPT